MTRTPSSTLDIPSLRLMKHPLSLGEGIERTPFVTSAASFIWRLCPWRILISSVTVYYTALALREVAMRHARRLEDVGSVPWKGRSPPYPYRRTIIPRIHTPAAGSHTHWSSLHMICTPRREKNLRTLMGETSMGRHGKKYRVLLNGANRATPRPPLVSISSKGWERVDTNKKRKTTHQGEGLLRKSK